jgi:hypothetical protein
VAEGIRYELPPRFAHLHAISLLSPSWDKGQKILVDPEPAAP